MITPLVPIWADETSWPKPIAGTVTHAACEPATAQQLLERGAIDPPCQDHADRHAAWSASMVRSRTSRADPHAGEAGNCAICGLRVEGGCGVLVALTPDTPVVMKDGTLETVESLRVTGKL